MDMKRYIFSAIISLLSTSSYAVTITPDTISAASGCDLAQADCTVNWDSQVHLGNYDAIQITRSTGSAWLFRYDLYAPSADTTITGFDGTIQDYSGNIWLEAPTTFNDSSNIFVNVYTDQISPDPDALSYDIAASTWSFMMTSADAANASGVFTSTGDNGSGAITTGDLVVFDGILTCIECAVDVQLNLIGFNYLGGSINFNPADSRTLLLKYNDSDPFDPLTTERLFYVAPVPVPAAIWLFMSGLCALIAFRRKD